MIYVLSLKTWKEWDRAHHWYGCIHWEAPEPCDHGNIRMANGETRCTVCDADHSGAGFQSADSETEPDADGATTIRHDTRESAVAGARRWYAKHAKPGDALVLGVWGLCGWERDEPFEVLEGAVT